jgi:ribosomal peptide maturation radical SAM protein 1
MHESKQSVLLVAMPFAGLMIPSIQLPVLEGYCKQRGISISSRHLYLKAAEFYGLQNYNYLIYPPNDSYSAQMVYSRYVFPQHWKNNEEKFKEYYTSHTSQNKEMQPFSFEKYVQRTDLFYQWVFDHVDWRSFDIIGFTLNYGQLLPSLAIAKKIKEISPEKKIVFGGSRTVETLGMNVLRAFDYIDFVVSGDGEDTLYLLASNEGKVESIPRLMYRSGDQVLWNTSEAVVDLNNVPIPSYDQFYQELASVSSDIQQFFQYYGRLPVEISRGCWWNRCTFCNLNVQHQCFREKSADRIIQEILYLSDRYHMMEFQLIGNTLPKTEYQTLFEKIKQQGRDFSFFVEARAGQLKSDDYRLMKDAGFNNIQTGIESLSPHYLRKMNKGVRVIDNIAVLKFCKENGIKNSYNLIVRYPNEEPVDFEETKKAASLLKGYLDPPQLCELRVMFGSPIHRHPEQFNIETLISAPLDLLMYPPDFLEKGFSFVYDFTQKKPSTKHDWESLIEEWKKEREELEIEGIQRQTAIDRLVFYFVDGGSFLKVYDKRDCQNIRIFMLNALERAVFLACIDVVSLTELQERFASVPEFELVAILQSFEQNGLVFVEDERYLCLPLRCRIGTVVEKNVECPVNVTA